VPIKICLWAASTQGKKGSSKVEREFAGVFKVVREKEGFSETKGGVQWASIRAVTED